MKKEGRIIWNSVSFKEHMEMNTHWEFVGIDGEKLDKRFLLFCDKGINVLLKDLKTNEIFDVPFGAQMRGKKLALDILKGEDENI